MTNQVLVLTGILSVAIGYAGLLAQAPAATPPATPAPAIDVERLPIDLERLERQVRQPVAREGWDGFRLRYVVDVYGKAPRLHFFTPDEVLPGAPVPGSAPTHRDMLEVMTPKEYRAPAADFSSLMRWLQEKLK